MRLYNITQRTEENNAPSARVYRVLEGDVPLRGHREGGFEACRHEAFIFRAVRQG
jgi:hypothetical protein